jgi:hypothetical protein
VYFVRYRDKKVVGVFVRFRAARFSDHILSPALSSPGNHHFTKPQGVGLSGVVTSSVNVVRSMATRPMRTAKNLVDSVRPCLKFIDSPQNRSHPTEDAGRCQFYVQL